MFVGPLILTFKTIVCDDSPRGVTNKDHFDPAANSHFVSLLTVNSGSKKKHDFAIAACALLILSGQ